MAGARAGSGAGAGDSVRNSFLVSRELLVLVVGPVASGKVALGTVGEVAPPDLKPAFASTEVTGSGFAGGAGAAAGVVAWEGAGGAGGAAAAAGAAGAAAGAAAAAAAEASPVARERSSS